MATPKMAGSKTRAKTPTSKGKAVEAAKSLARAARHTEIVVHDRTGRIVEKHGIAKTIGQGRDADASSDEIDFAKAKVVHRGPKPVRLPLRELREACRKTQVEVATAAELAQSEVSRIERRDDVLLSTLRRYVRALGGELELTAVLETGHRIDIDL